MDENKIDRCIDEIKAESTIASTFRGDCVIVKMLRLVISRVNARFVNHFSSSVSCFLYEMPRSKFSPRLINSRATIWAAFFAFRENIFAGDPQKKWTFLCWARLESAVRRRRGERATKSETNQQKAKHAKQLFHWKCVFSDVRWLFYLHSIQRLFGRIFLHTSGWHNSKVAKLKRKS